MKLPTTNEGMKRNGEYEESDLSHEKMTKWHTCDAHEGP